VFVQIRRAAAICFTVVSVGVVAFQVALAAGAPLGAFAMGGTFPGQFPAALRVAALVQAALIALMAAVILSCGGIGLPAWSRGAHRFVWVIVAVAAIGSVLNLITPSSGERAIWAPVSFLMLASSLAVALGGRSSEQQ
jgi:hypothetical protein